MEKARDRLDDPINRLNWQPNIMVRSVVVPHPAFMSPCCLVRAAYPIKNFLIRIYEPAQEDTSSPTAGKLLVQTRPYSKTTLDHNRPRRHEEKRLLPSSLLLPLRCGAAGQQRVQRG